MATSKKTAAVKKKIGVEKPLRVKRGYDHKIAAGAVLKEREARAAEDALHGHRIDQLVTAVTATNCTITAIDERVSKLESLKFIADPEVLIGGFEEPPHLIHEFADGSHRIIAVSYDSVKHGKWAAKNEIAVLDHYRAATGHYEGVFPPGIFTLSSAKFSGMVSQA